MTKSNEERISKEALCKLNDEMISVSDMSKILGLTPNIINYWKKKFKIKTKRPIGCPLGYKRSDDELARRPSMKGALNPFYGKTHSTETKRKMSNNHADFTGINNPYRNALLKNPEKRLEASKRKKDWWASRTSEYMEKIKEEMSARPLTNGSIGRGHKNGYHYSKKTLNGKFWYRSSWELLFAQKIDSCDKIIKYEVEQIRISYINSEGKKRWTHFDFHLFLDNGEEIIIEIKPDAISEIKQSQLLEQVKWCIDNQKQYAIINKEIIDNHFDKLITMISDKELNANTFIGRGVITAKITLDAIECKSKQS